MQAFMRSFVGAKCARARMQYVCGFMRVHDTYRTDDTSFCADI